MMQRTRTMDTPSHGISLPLYQEILARFKDMYITPLRDRSMGRLEAIHGL
jgi:hypothetical protein